METRLGKPVHDWREFFNEIGRIVLGVLIALSGEQIVAAAHWRHVTHGTLAEIQRDLAMDEAVLDERSLVQGCAAQRLAELKAVLWKARASHTIPALSLDDIEMPPQPINRSAWTTAVASGLTLRMGPRERHGLADLDSILAEYDANQVEENRLWSTFKSLSNSPGRISDDLVSTNVIALSRLIYINQYNYDVSKYGKSKMRKLGIAADYSAVLDVADGSRAATRSLLLQEIPKYAVCRSLGQGPSGSPR